jgi:hypothetical protein
VSISTKYPQLFARLLDKIYRKPKIVLDCDGSEFTRPRELPYVDYLENLLSGIVEEMSQGKVPTSDKWKMFFMAAYYLSKENRSSEVFKRVYWYINHLNDCELIFSQNENTTKFLKALFATNITRNVSRELPKSIPFGDFIQKPLG